MAPQGVVDFIEMSELAADIAAFFTADTTYPEMFLLPTQKRS